jgi:preprotein translocase subunit SecF
MFQIIQRRYLYFMISLLIIVPGLIGLAVWGLPLSIDFTGGSLVEARFAQSTETIDLEQVRQAYAAEGFTDVSVQTTRDNATGLDNGIVVRSQALTQAQQSAILATLSTNYGPATVESAETVGPSVGREVAGNAALAVLAAAGAILAYIWFAFRGVEHAYRYGVAAIIALLHDVLVVVGLSALAGHFLGWQINALFLTALLTVVGFSVHDTIVVFDRIRENLRLYRRLDYETVVNHSVVQTLDRSINTQLTVLFTLLALALFGGETTRPFVITLLVGIASGTYSSIFNAAALLVVWEKREWRTWFGRGNQTAVTA